MVRVGDKEQGVQKHRTGGGSSAPQGCELRKKPQLSAAFCYTRCLSLGCKLPEAGLCLPCLAPGIAPGTQVELNHLDE